MSDKLPLGEGIPADKQRELFALVQHTPVDNPALAYQVAIPKSWSNPSVNAESDDLSTEKLTLLGHFLGPEENGLNPQVQIQAMKLPREMRAAHWLRHFATETERELEALVEPSEHIADSLMAFTIEDVEFKARAFVRVVDDRVFLLFAFSEASLFESLNESFGVSVKMFRLKQAATRSHVEELQQMPLPDEMSFAVPKSWKVVADQASDEHSSCNVFNLDNDGVLNGWLRVESIAKTDDVSVPQLLERLAKPFTDAGVQVAETISLEPMEFENPAILEAATEIRLGNLPSEDGVQQELWLSFIEFETRFVSVTLLTPNRAAVFFVWAMNKRAMEIAVESVAATKDAA